jgi:hypothetical protein
MKLDLPHDKALHVIAGSLVAAVVCVGFALLFLFFGVRVHPGGIPVVALLATLLVGKGKEMLDERSNGQDLIAGRPPSHSVETADIIYTVVGGAIVTVPAFLFLALFQR